MSVLQFLSKMKRLGISIKLAETGRQLEIEAPEGVLQPGIISELKSKKQEVIDFLEKARKRNKYASILPPEKKEYYPLSSTQRRMYVLQQMDKTVTAYNMPHIWQLEGFIDKNRLQRTFNRLAPRHESLRTSFEIIQDELVQRIHPSVEIQIENYDFEKNRDEVTGSERSCIHSFIRPFDLTRTPLMRVGLISGEKDTHVFIVDMHHIISDGISHDIFMKDLIALYLEKKLPPLKLQYKDYSEWYWRREEKDGPGKQEEFWLSRFAGEIPVLNIATDYNRPAIQNFEGDTVDFELDEVETKKIKELAQSRGATLFMVLTALFNVLLSKLSGQEDIVLGTTIAGRNHPDLEPIIGMFVNTLALRNYPSAGKSFPEFLREVKDRTLQDFENQEYPFEELVEKVTLDRDFSRNPLFDVMISLQNRAAGSGQMPAGQMDTFKVKPYTFDNKTATFDLVLMAIEGENRLYLSLDYCTKLFREETIRRFTSYFKQMVSGVIENSNRKISLIEIIPAKEKNRVLYDFNKTGTPYPRDKTIHELFAEQAREAGHRAALIAAKEKPNTEPGTMTLTYNQLNRESHRLAVTLKEKGVAPGSIVGIMVTRSAAMITGMLAVLKAGGAYLPLDHQYPRERIRYILEKSGTDILLTQKQLIETFKDLDFKKEIIDLDDESIYRGAKKPDAIQDRTLPRDLAYVIYTSGSTGNPKGVAVEHGNVVNFITGVTSKIDFSPGKTILAVTTISFDIFVLETLLPLAAGLKLVIANEQQQTDPHLLAKVITRNCIDMLQLTPSRLNLLYAADKNLACLAGPGELMVGGEAFPENLFETVKKKYKGKIYNMYGPTETTVWSAIKDLTAAQKVNIGTPIANTQIYIVASNHNIQPAGIAGELFIGGDGVARGYLDNPEMTDERFCLRPPGAPRRGGPICCANRLYRFSFVSGLGRNMMRNSLLTLKVPGKSINRSYLSHRSYISYLSYYKTGDLARWITGGPTAELEFLGRIDYQVKIRGFRIELEEIEEQLTAHEKIKEAVVLVKGNDSDKYLCAYIVPVTPGTFEKKPDFAQQLSVYLSGKLPGYMIPSFFIPIEEMPLTPNGKIQRKALPEPGKKTGEKYSAPRDEIEKKLADLWAGVLNIKLPPEAEQHPIGIDDNFFRLGGHSIKATILVSRIYEIFDVKLPLAELFKLKTIRALSQYIKHSGKTRYQIIEPREKREYYDVSYGQKRVWLLSQNREASLSFNMTNDYLFKRELDIQTINKVFNRLIRRHESLRTVFLLIEEKIGQKVLAAGQVEFHPEYEDLRAVENKDETVIKLLETGHDTPFDLQKGPLIRVKLIQTREKEYILFTAMHHIISDFLSMEVLSKEFVRLYRAFERREENPLKPLKIQYKDFALWQNKQLSEANLERLQEYWRGKFAGKAPVLELPYDHARPGIQSYNGGTVDFALPPDITAKLRTTAAENNSTLFMILYAAMNVFLFFYTGQTDIVMGIPASGREHPDLENQIGFYLNTLAIRTVFREEHLFLQLLEIVKKVTTEAYLHQMYPFDRLIDDLKIKREPGRHPLFDVVVDMITVNRSLAPPDDMWAKPGQESKNEEFTNYSKGKSKFDLTIYFFEGLETINVFFEYNRDLFEPKTITRMAKRFRKLLDRITGEPDISISKLLQSSEEIKIPVFGFTAGG